MAAAVFAPTNAAFADVPEALLYYLLRDIPALTAVLTYHVVNGKVLSTGLADGVPVTSLGGGNLTISIDGTVMVDGATVIAPDIDASNGVIHGIDKVLVPGNLVLPTLVDVAAADPDDNFSTLLAAADNAGLVDTLRGPGPFTVFAPINGAFDMLPDGTVAALLADDDKTPLKDILLYHVVPKHISPQDILDGVITTAETVEGFVLTFSVISVMGEEDILMVNGTPIFSSAFATNGIAHVIGEVLLPPTDNIVEIAVGSDDFTTLVTAVTEAGLVDTLSGAGPFSK
jgi:transforming growth factor-beta-induced protein